MNGSKLATRTAGAIAAVLLLAGQVLTAPAASAAHASPAATYLKELERTSDLSTFGTQSPRSITAYCPPGKVIVGGGGRVRERGTPTHRLTLTRLEPSISIVTPTGIRQGYQVTAATTDPASAGFWAVEAYALCALPITGRHIVATTSTNLADPMQAAAAVCPAGERVLGTGARINNKAGHGVGLQVARSSASGDIARAQAHESADGFPGTWSVAAFAVCAPEPSGYEVRTFISQERLSEPVKTVTAECSGNRYLIGAGAAVTKVASGSVTLEQIYPLAVNALEVHAAENAPTDENWDFIVATAICADATLAP
jgi:hypothetical protein